MMAIGHTYTHACMPTQVHTDHQGHCPNNALHSSSDGVYASRGAGVWSHPSTQGQYRLKYDWHPEVGEILSPFLTVGFVMGETSRKYLSSIGVRVTL